MNSYFSEKLIMKFLYLMCFAVLFQSCSENKELYVADEEAIKNKSSYDVLYTFIIDNFELIEQKNLEQDYCVNIDECYFFTTENDLREISDYSIIETVVKDLNQSNSANIEILTRHDSTCKFVIKQEFLSRNSNTRNTMIQHEIVYKGTNKSSYYPNEKVIHSDSIGKGVYYNIVEYQVGH